MRSKNNGMYASLVETVKGTYDLIGLLDDLREKYKNDLLRYRSGLTDKDIFDALQQAHPVGGGIAVQHGHVHAVFAEQLHHGNAVGISGNTTVHIETQVHTASNRDKIFSLFIFLLLFRQNVFPFMYVGPIVTSAGKIPVLR